MTREQIKKRIAELDEQARNARNLAYNASEMRYPRGVFAAEYELDACRREQRRLERLLRTM